MKLRLNKYQKRNPFFDNFEYLSEITGFARPRKGRSSKKDKAKTKCSREWRY